jgi:tetratricopeptide (TPR) repeat protein
MALNDKGDPNGAIAAYRAAISIDKDYAAAYVGLANALHDKGDVDGAIAEYRAAIGIKKDYAEAHDHVGSALKDKGDVDGAIAEYCAAIHIKKDYAEAHYNPGRSLHDKGDLGGAIASYREAIKFKKDFVEARYNCANALHGQGKLTEAEAVYCETIELKPDFAQAHCNLGFTLQEQGRFADAVAALKRGHELGSPQPTWRYPPARWVREVERLFELDSQLPAILSGQEQPTDAGERAEYANLCQKKHLYASAARFYREAIAAQSALVASADNGLRYNAACAAALAGCNAGEDAAKQTDAERAGFRKQALAWLRADLDAGRGLLDKGPNKARAVVTEKMQHWLRDSDFNGVRGSEALGKLPEAERKEWQQLWADVADTLAKARGEKTKSAMPQ